jgi:hypothetical protein
MVVVQAPEVPAAARRLRIHAEVSLGMVMVKVISRSWT